ncbi:E3 ubiquitin-protein ligase RNF103-like [Oppia nitens]|uniref:E3 ubiquitin-protein ligase RNF103-like n=1 Tax=Oppia nitens TaxID=1686743 RepID=UPI0023D9AA31|nr:E3 ubiquitin-protein ligase RNF103-like [Oppia nitens]
MWLKVLLMTSFVLFMLLLSRLMEMTLNGNQLISTQIFVNTIGLSVRQLKYLLDIRGVSYDGVLEKSELIQLVDQSGSVSERQLMDAEYDIQQQTTAEFDNNADIGNNNGMNSDDTHTRNQMYDIVAKSDRRFSCGAHLYEEVEDTKDSAWILNVMAIDGHNRIDSKLWKKVVDKCNKYGIRTAIFDCALDPKLCQRKSWNTSRLILALPREGLKTKEDVLMITYFIGQNTKFQQIIDWIHKQLVTRVTFIESEEELENKWLQSSSNSSMDVYNDIKMVFISSLSAPPLILSALAIKFSGRIKFGFFKTSANKKKSLAIKLDKRIPSYIIVLSDRHYNYGQKSGENLKYLSIELMLRTLRPETNDVFLLSLLLTNLSLALHLFWMKCSKLWKHLVFWFILTVKYNCILFLIWLAIHTLLACDTFPMITQLCTYGHRFCQYLSLTEMATILRYDIQYNYKFPFLLISFITFGLLLAFIRRKLITSDDNDDHHLFHDWTPWESTLLTYILFRPISMTLFRSRTNTSIDINLEEGMELLIERLAVPNLWLQTELISSDYIKELPIWIHHNPVDDCDLSTNETNESDNNSSCDDLVTNRQSRMQCQTLVTQMSYQMNSNQLNSSQMSGNFHHSDDCHCIGSSDTTKVASNIRLKSNNVNSNACPAKCRKEVVIRHRSQKNDEILANSDHNLNKCFIPQGMIKCNDCAICLETYRTGISICGLPCGHNYHQNCIMLWLYRDNHICPICRWPTYKQKPKQE